MSLNYLLRSLCKFTILLQEIPWLSQDDIFCATLQYFETKYINFCHKKNVLCKTEGQKLQQVTMKAKLLYPHVSEGSI
jgi:hypothetical protein